MCTLIDVVCGCEESKVDDDDESLFHWFLSRPLIHELHEKEKKKKYGTRFIVVS